MSTKFYQLCAKAMGNSSEFLTQSSLFRKEWTTELGEVGQKVWAEVLGTTDLYL